MGAPKLFSLLVTGALAVYGAIGWFFLPLASFNGDLTRVGMLPETLFGWTRPQPAIESRFLQQSPWETADVLVIGDSFSGQRVWQSVLTSHGLRVRTESWTSILAVCEDVSSWLGTKRFTGRYVVLETVERYVRPLSERSMACQRMRVRPTEGADIPIEPPMTTFGPRAQNYSGRLSVGLGTKINGFRYERARVRPEFSSWASGTMVHISRVPDGCRLFSHLRCQDALFLNEDNQQAPGDDVIANLEALSARFRGVTPIWAIVPNKSTAYLFPHDSFWDRVALRVPSVNLAHVVREAVADHVVDLYPANNAHLSTAGYLRIGEAIRQRLF